MYKSNETNSSYEIDLSGIFNIIWDRKYLIISLTSVFGVLSIIYSLFLPNVYTSSALLAPSNGDQSLSSKLGGYSSLAGLAGVNISNDADLKTTEAIERIKSFEFFSNYFLPNVNLEDIMAVKKWIPEKDTLVYKNRIYDSNEKKWVRKASFPYQTIPSDQEAFEKFIEDVLVVREDKQTTFLQLSISHKSPHVAKHWADIIIKNINESMREIDKRSAQEAIDFLNESTQSTNVQSLKEVTSRLLEDQMQILMLASSEEAYVFKTIDSPISPEEKTSPNRLLIIMLITFFGGILSVILVLIQTYIEQKKSIHSTS